MNTTAQPQGWHTSQWGTYGWLETIAKIVGIVAAFIAFAQASSAPDLIIGGNPELGAIILLAVLTVLWTFTLTVRFQQKEIIAMIFGIFNALGHAAVLLAMLKMPGSTGMAMVFAIAYIVGEVFKRVFLVTTGYTESGRSKEAMSMVSNVFIGIYVAILVFLII